MRFSISRKDKPRFLSEEIIPTKLSDSTTAGTALSSQPPTKENKIGLIGVKGWLQFLIVWLILLGPLVNIVIIEAKFIGAESNFPGLVSFNEWNVYKISLWAATVVCIALSIFAGLGLANGNSWKDVKRTKVILFIVGPLAALLMKALIPFMIFGSIKEMIPEIIGLFFPSLLWAFFWTFFLSKSIRVHNTYCRNNLSED